MIILYLIGASSITATVTIVAVAAIPVPISLERGILRSLPVRCLRSVSLERQLILMVVGVVVVECVKVSVGAGGVESILGVAAQLS
jgi:hypothetical protein